METSEEHIPKPIPYELVEVEDRDIHGRTLGVSMKQAITVGDIIIDFSLPKPNEKKEPGLQFHFGAMESRNTSNQFVVFDRLYNLREGGENSNIYIRLHGQKNRIRISIEAPPEIRISRMPRHSHQHPQNA